MSELLVNLDSLARCWGAKDWGECNAAITQGYGWAMQLGGGVVLVRRDNGSAIPVEQWRAERR